MRFSWFRILVLFLPVLVMACGTSELQEQLQGRWVYELSAEERLRRTAFERILSESPPLEEELVEMGLTGQDLRAAQETLSLRMVHSGSQVLNELRQEFEQEALRKESMVLTISGNRLSLSVDGRVLSAEFVVESEVVDDLRIRTTAAGGVEETQIILWHGDNRFSMTDPQGETLGFARE